MTPNLIHTCIYCSRCLSSIHGYEDEPVVDDLLAMELPVTFHHHNVDSSPFDTNMETLKEAFLPGVPSPSFIVTLTPTLS
ncbi:hypothetical protein Hypma_007807 [Hypsizygus marmoreus]|uniref:Uncharacterized protein n=1 Tax=Hypsizygus marmoreus TaxID=39966 RepID=A0A369K0V5_HYPMA|nr:hypothetical protein Hypma_007807 [Hypsizygus marmoreus]